jgi:hypothetical protein
MNNTTWFDIDMRLLAAWPNNHGSCLRCHSVVTEPGRTVPASVRLIHQLQFLIFVQPIAMCRLNFYTMTGS